MLSASKPRESDDHESSIRINITEPPSLQSSQSTFQSADSPTLAIAVISSEVINSRLTYNSRLMLKSLKL